MILSDANKREEKVRRLAEWRLWFAWHPVRIRPSGDVVWWENVERKTEFFSAYDGTYAFTYYRRPGDETAKCGRG
jgi:hypothetical protein